MEPIWRATEVHGAYLEGYRGAWSLFGGLLRCMEPIWMATEVHEAYLEGY